MKTNHNPAAICGSCRHWRPDQNKTFGFVERLSKKLGRKVEVGFCHATHEFGTGPTADGDWCEKWEDSTKSP